MKPENHTSLSLVSSRDHFITQAVCPVCGNSYHEYLYKTQKSKIYKCSKCDSLHLIAVDSPIGEKGETQCLFQDVDAVEYLNLLEKYWGSTLDGQSVLVLSSFNVDPLIRSIASRGARVDRFESPSSAQVGGPYSIVIAFYLVENASDPKKTFTQIRPLLMDDGILFNIGSASDSLSSKVMKSRWYGFNRISTFCFNKENLTILLDLSGFKDIWFEKSRSLSVSHVIRNGPWVSNLMAKLLKTASNRILLQNQLNLKASEVCVFSKKIPDAQVMVGNKLSIIMPVFNEVMTFRECFDVVYGKNLGEIKKELIVVESNSTDGTRECVKQIESFPGVKVIYEDFPRGKGSAVRKGLAAATGNIIIIQDGDLEYDIDDYNLVLEPLVRNEKMFVLGSRHTGTWKMREFSSKKILASYINLGQVFLTALINIACGTKLKDPFTMYKVFRKSALYGIEFTGNGFDLDYEIVLKMVKRKGFVPKEIPINYHSRSFADGKKVKLISDPLKGIWTIFKYGVLNQNTSSKK